MRKPKFYSKLIFEIFSFYLKYSSWTARPFAEQKNLPIQANMNIKLVLSELFGTEWDERLNPDLQDLGVI